MRVAQLARAMGILPGGATQRPRSRNHGCIRRTFPRAIFGSSMVDSRTILDTGGADHLVGQGDMLLSSLDV